MNLVLCPKCHTPQNALISLKSQTIVATDVIFQARHAIKHITGYALTGASIGRQTRFTQPLIGSAIGAVIGGVVGSFTCDISWTLIKNGINDSLFSHYQCSNCGHQFKRFDF